jgi:lipoate-protein ligase B
MRCTAYDLGQVDYLEAHRFQAALAHERARGSVGDIVLLLEHPPTITVGKSGQLKNVLASQETLSEKGIRMFFTDRGGDVTYHGPGQLVGYPIIDLRNRGKDLHRYVRELEEAVIRTVGDFGIEAHRDRGHRGVWLGDEELAAFGLRVREWVTLHGFALNVSTDLQPFSLINPCGFPDRSATSMSALLCEEVSMAAVKERFLARFSEVFETEVEWAPSEQLRSHVCDSKTSLLV